MVVRTNQANAQVVATRLADEIRAEVAPHPGDGRLVIVLEDGPAGMDARSTSDSAAARLARIALWPEVLSTSLVFEYSGPDAPAPETGADHDFHTWRGQPGARPKNDKSRDRA